MDRSATGLAPTYACRHAARPGAGLLLAALLAFPMYARGFESPAPPGEPATPAASETSVMDETASADAEAPASPGDAAVPDPCGRPPEDDALQEETRDLLRSWSCYTFRWFDSWWGHEHDFDESQVNGWIIGGVDYRQYDGFDPRLRLKVRAPLPNLDTRWDILLGRVDDDAYISDTEVRENALYSSGLIDRGREDSWLLGLGHRRSANRKGWDWSAGVHLRVPLEPYAKVAWFYRQRFTANTDLRFRQTLFWRDREGFGTTSRADLATAFGARDVLRWEVILKVSEETDGTNWYAANTWYHLLQNGSALSLKTFGSGETQRDVGMEDGGFELIWRRPFTRDWMYLSMGPSLTWPRLKPEDEREMNIGFGVWLEMEFGDWRY